ncbi:Nn.00g044460.m01.CDS01 [Neocucurbitaria sp. VM-36]
MSNPPQNDGSYARVSRNSRDTVSYTDIPIESRAVSHKVPNPTPTATATAEERQSGTSSFIDLQPVQWRISLYTPISMIALFISGILVALGHHLFYSRFDGTTVRSSADGASEYISQTWIIRYGTAFAFVAKTLLAGAVIVGYKQHMWINLRRKANTVATIDAVFAATHDFLAFLSPVFLLRAKIPALMALVAWCLPLAALITPSTLLVVPSTFVNSTMLQVPTLNLNDTLLYRSHGLGDSSSPVMHRLTVATATGMRILPMRRVLAPNTTYQHIFDGYSLKCEEATGQRLMNISAVFNETRNQVLKEAQVSSGNADIKYLSFTLVEDEKGVVLSRNVSEFVSRCVMGATYNTCAKADWGPAIWARLGNESITCAAHTTRFTLDFAAQGDTQTITNVGFEWKEKINNDVVKQLNIAIATLLNGLFGVFEGGGAGGGLFTDKTMIVDTALLELVQRTFEDLRETVPQENWMSAERRTFPEMIEELSRNQTLSLFSNEKLWLPAANASQANVTQSTFVTIYEYRPQNLWLAYGIAVAFSFAGVILGLRALWLNGVSHDNSFSSIMATTRNSFLDDLTLGYSLGAAPLPKDIARTRLRFGELTGDVEKMRLRAGFGLEEMTMPLRKEQVIH